jgi:HSP20 family protein
VLCVVRQEQHVVGPFPRLTAVDADLSESAGATRRARDKEDMDMFDMKSQSNGTLARVPALSEDLDDFSPSLRELWKVFDQPFAFRQLDPAWVPTDIVETAEALVLRLDLPGHDPQQIHVQLEGSTLSVHSEAPSEERVAPERVLHQERRNGAVTRSFAVPPEFDATKIEARFIHGTLTLTLPRRAEHKPRTIEVKVKG